MRQHPVNPCVLSLWGHVVRVLEMFDGFAGLAGGCMGLTKTVVDVPRIGRVGDVLPEDRNGLLLMVTE
ncbi:MAG: hypothetical protein IIC18_03940 [Bacteroidetes bacterium]|nr:hypothetical protein [Bacteroidota bacterium]